MHRCSSVTYCSGGNAPRFGISGFPTAFRLRSDCFAAPARPCLLHAGEAEKAVGNPPGFPKRGALPPGNRSSSGCIWCIRPVPISYWKNPGIVGLATTIGAGPVVRLQRRGNPVARAPGCEKWHPTEAQGYEGETLLMIPVTPPSNPRQCHDGHASTPRVSWMCCGKTCMPAVKVPFSITLPVAASAAPGSGDSAVVREISRPDSPPGPGVADDRPARARQADPHAATAPPARRSRQNPFLHRRRPGRIPTRNNRSGSSRAVPSA